ncbi:MAG: ATP phosphoribosyltransferase [Spirochaetes bacterium]|jgi:ATP phosphoribosyltransferase|nr:ATP phosphoribosyltransferase [Spirochaetota bacterium]
MKGASETPLTLALPKGRLFDQTQEHFARRGIYFEVEKRKLVAYDTGGLLKIILVKNSDLPVYVNHGIAGLGICGADVIYESGQSFFTLHEFDYGSTTMSLATRRDYDPEEDRGHMTVATKFTRYARDYFHRRGIPVEIIKLNGSVELAPVLGLAPYIVDLVETGSTLHANDLVVREELERINVHLIANPAYFKFHYRRVNDFLKRLRSEPEE